MRKIYKSDEEIVSLFKSGKTLQEIGAPLGVSRQRIQQILAKHGVGRYDGGTFKKEHKWGRAVIQKGLEDRCFAKWGIGRKQRSFIRKRYGRSPFAKFTQQRMSAKRRGIPFKFTFGQWWALWMASGKWHQRSVVGFVMARYGDSGPYEPSNVRICTASDNLREYHDRRRQLMVL